MSSERLNELRRQRALMQQHLEWLDREIDDVSNERHKRPATAIPSPHSSLSSAPEPEIPPPEIPVYEPDPQTAGIKAKKGCLLLFVGVLGLGLALLVFIYFWKYSDRPLLFAEPQTSIIEVQRSYPIAV